MHHLSRPAVPLVVLAAVALGMGVSAPAVAHDGLIAAAPAPGELVSTELTEVTLDFSQDFLDLNGMTNAFAIQVSGPGGRFYNIGCVELEPSRISIDTELGASGQYTVVWQIVSSDGHPTSDSFGFVYDKPAEVVAAEGSVQSDSCTPTTSPTPTPTSTSTSTSTGMLATAPSAPPAAGAPDPTIAAPLIAGGVGVAVVTALATVSLVRRRRAS